MANAPLELWVNAVGHGIVESVWKGTGDVLWAVGSGHDGGGGAQRPGADVKSCGRTRGGRGSAHAMCIKGHESRPIASNVSRAGERNVSRRTSQKVIPSIPRHGQGTGSVVSKS